MGTAQQVWEWVGRNLWQIIVVASLFIEFTPIKINPLSAIFKWLGRALTGDITKKLDEITAEVRDNEKDRIRWEILDFANSCHNRRKHTKDEFRHIDKLNKKYIKLLQETKDTNGEFEVEYEYIKDLYAERTRKNDFLENREGISDD
jgi:hypothetical protein